MQPAHTDNDESEESDTRVLFPRLRRRQTSVSEKHDIIGHKLQCLTWAGLASCKLLTLWTRVWSKGPAACSQYLMPGHNIQEASISDFVCLTKAV